MPTVDELDKAIFDCDSEKLLSLLTSFQTKSTEQVLFDYMNSFTSDQAAQFWRITRSGIQKAIDIALEASSRIGCGGEVADDEELVQELEKEKAKATETLKQSKKGISKKRILNSEKHEEVFREKLCLFHGVISAAHVFYKATPYRPSEFGATIYALHTLLNYIDEPSENNSTGGQTSLDFLGDNFTASFSSSISLATVISTFKYSISFLCEQLYLRGENGSTLFLPLVIIYLLSESLKQHSREILVRRLYAIKNGFQFLEFTASGATVGASSALKGPDGSFMEEEEEEDIFHKELLLRCFIHPTFLKCAEGEKLLSFFLSLNNGFLVKSVLKIVKIQLASGIKTLSSVYGELFFRAWRDCSTIILNAVSPAAGGTMISTGGGAVAAAGRGKKSSESSGAVPTSSGPDLSNLSDDHVRSCQYTLHLLSEGLQELLHDASHLNNSKHFHGLRFFFQAFHDLKRSEFLEEFLLYLYEPILWRGLKCANAIVRTQTSILFFDVFPLQRVRPSGVLVSIYSQPPEVYNVLDAVQRSDRKSLGLGSIYPTGSSGSLGVGGSAPLNANMIEQNELLLQKQFDILTELLMDSDPRVRVSSIFGVGHILRQYWEVIPLQTAKTILKFLTEQLACDTCGSTTTPAASASALASAGQEGGSSQYTGSMTGSGGRVRHAVIKALKEVLRQPLAHGLMRALLPSISKLLHDRVERVRLEFIELLIQVKSVRDMHFYEVVPIRHLLFRFAQDKDRETISYALTELLLNSFYPQNSSTGASNGTEVQNEPEERVFRCIKFIEQNELAAEAFYSNLHYYVNIGSLTKMMAMLFLRLKDSAVLEDDETSASNSVGSGKKKKKKTIAPDEKNELDDADDISSKDRKRKNKLNLTNDDDTQGSGVSGSLPLTTQFGILRILLVMVRSSKKKFIKQVPSLELFFRIFNAKNFISWIEVVLYASGRLYHDPEAEEIKGNMMILSTTFELIGEVAQLARTCDVSSFLNELHAIRDLFTVNTVLGEVIAPYFKIDVVKTSSSSDRSAEEREEKKFLCKFLLMKSAVSFLQAMNYSVELVGAVKTSMQNFYEQISVGQTFVSPTAVVPSNLSYILPLQVSAHALNSFLGFICDPDSSFSEISAQTADHLELLFKYIKLSLKILAHEPELYNQLDLPVKKTLIVFTRAWFTYAVYEDSSRCLLALTSAEEDKTSDLSSSSSSVYLLLEFFHKSILPTFFTYKAFDPHSASHLSFLQQLLNNFLLALTDGLHLMDEGHMSSIFFALHALLSDYYKNFLLIFTDLSEIFLTADPSFLALPSILDRLASIIRKNAHFDPTLSLSLSYVLFIIPSIFADALATSSNANLKFDESGSAVIISSSLHSSLHPIHGQFQKVSSKIIQSYNTQKAQKKKLLDNLALYYGVNTASVKPPVSTSEAVSDDEKEIKGGQVETKRNQDHDDYEEVNENEEVETESVSVETESEPQKPTSVLELPLSSVLVKEILNSL